MDSALVSDKRFLAIKENTTQKFVFREYNIIVNLEEVIFPDGTVFRSKTLANHLNDSKKCAIMAATLGHEVDRILKRLQYSDMAEALAADEFANRLIEEICDSAEKEIIEEARKQGLYTTTRYSPGYGDFSLENQSAILRLAGMREITVTENNLLLPQKSVTAVIGYTTEKSPALLVSPASCTLDKCSDCSSREKCIKNGKI